MKITYGKAEYGARVWNRSAGPIGDLFAYDTETTVVTDGSLELPELVLATAFNGSTVFFIRREDLAEFWGLHENATVFMHTAKFDVAVTTKLCSFNFGPMVESGRLYDVSILYRLLHLAKTGEMLEQGYSLDALSERVCRVVLDKDDAIRLGFGKYLVDGAVNYAAMPEAALVYAARDAIATYLTTMAVADECCKIQDAAFGEAASLEAQKLYGPLSHHIQLKGDLALNEIERRGITIDPGAVTSLLAELEPQIAEAVATLDSYGYREGAKGVNASCEKILREIEARRGTQLPRTNTGKISQKKEHLELFFDEPFVDALLTFKQLKKTKETYVERMRGKTHVHPKYRLMVKTGRTSCSVFNVQNLPRKGRVRECVVASPGHVLIACDYSGLELCTLSQIAFGRYGHSRMREQINAGADLHKFTASNILGKEPSLVSKEDRQKAKAINFALPGGMSVSGLRRYAATSYGVTLTEEEAESWKKGWLDLYPEMRTYLERDDDEMELLGRTLDVDEYPGKYIIEPSRAAMIVMRIAGGAIETTGGRVFSKDELDWAWEQIADGRAGKIKKFADAIAERKGSKDLQRAIKPGKSASIPTGRIRADCAFTELSNWPFQALASDGAKLALYDLERAGLRVVAFIHDEVLVEVPEANDYRDVADQISGIMIAAMRRVCPDVQIKTEAAVMYRWTKGAQPKVVDGRLVAWDERQESLQKAA